MQIYLCRQLVLKYLEVNKMAEERFIKLTTDDQFTIVSFPEVLDKGVDGSFNKMVHLEIDCEIYERVCLRSISVRGISILVDESGILKGKRPNMFPWLLYSCFNLEAPIVGDVLFVGEHRIGELQELDFCGLTQDQIDYLTDLFKSYIYMIGK